MYSSQVSTAPISEKTYTVQSIWILKQILRALGARRSFLVRMNITFVIFVVFIILDWPMTAHWLNLAISLYLLLLVLYAAWYYAVRANFHFSLDPDFLYVKEGVLNVKEGHVPYATLQNVHVNQDLSDRLCGIFTVFAENVSQDKQSALRDDPDRFAAIGVYKNVVAIPGMTKQAAEVIKQELIQRMEECRANNSSGT